MRLLALLSLLLPFFACAPEAQAEAPPIQQWIDEAIRAGGGVVTIPEGEHELPAGLVIRGAQKLALRGVSKERCLLKLPARNTAPSGALITITGTAETLEIANLTLEGGSGTGSKISELILADGTASSADKAFKDIVVRDCIFQHFTGSAVLLRKVEEGVVERCSFHDGGSLAVAFHAGSKNCTARGNQITRLGKVFEIVNSSACTLLGNESRECGMAASLRNDGPASEKQRHILRNNHFSGAFLDLRSETGPPPLLEDNEGLVPPPAKQP